MSDIILSNSIRNAGTIERIVEIVNSGTCEGMSAAGGTEFTGGMLAGQYAAEAAIEAGVDCEISEDTIWAHLDILHDAGAEFDFSEAVRHGLLIAMGCTDDDQGMVEEARTIVAGWIEEGRTGVQWVMQELCSDDLDATLRGELEEPEKFELCAAAELKGGYRTGAMIHIAYDSKRGRAGLIYVGSGSNGVSVWTDAGSADDALRRYMTGDISN